MNAYIDEAELAELRAKAAERDELKAAEAERDRQAEDDQSGRPRDDVPHRALLADGSLHDYTGAHPTHVDNGDGPVPVLAVHQLPS